MGDLFKDVAPIHIVAYFIAVFNVMLATVGLEGITLNGDMQKDVQKWMDALTSPAE